MTWLTRQAAVVGLVALATAQLAVLGYRAGASPATGIGVGEDLSGVRVGGADGMERALVTEAPMLLLVFDPECAHSRRISPEWRAWLLEAGGPANVLALSAGSVTDAATFAQANGWPVRVATINPGARGSREHALTSRTPWVFAVDRSGRVLAEGHGARLPEVAAALASSDGLSP